MVFRPATFDFQPSRGVRHGFSLSADGSAEITGPDPVDRPTTARGSWHTDPSGQLVIDGPEGSRRVFEIESASPEKLVLKRRG